MTRLQRLPDALISCSAYLCWGLITDYQVISLIFAITALISLIPESVGVPAWLPPRAKTLSIIFGFTALIWGFLNRGGTDMAVAFQVTLNLPIVIAPVLLARLWGSPISPSISGVFVAREAISLSRPVPSIPVLDSSFRPDWPLILSVLLICSSVILNGKYSSFISGGTVILFLIIRAMAKINKFSLSTPVLSTLGVIFGILLSGAGLWVGMNSGDYMERKLNELSFWRGNDAAGSMSTAIGDTGRLDLGNEVRFRISWASQPAAGFPGTPVSSYIPVSIYDVTSDGKEWRSSIPPSVARPVYPESGVFTLETPVPGKPRNDLDTVTISGVLPGGRIPFPAPFSPVSIAALPVPQVNVHPIGGLYSIYARGFAKYTVVHHTSDDIDLSPPSETDLRIPYSLESLLNEVFWKNPELGSSVGLGKSAVKAVSDYFQPYTYTLDLSDAVHGGGRTLHSFLLSDKRGHCEYFASATVLMLRKAGIPARMVSGYMITEFDEQERVWWARASDAHAWVIWWDAEKSKWVVADNTPSGWPDQSKTGYWSKISDFFSRISYKIDTTDFESLGKALSSKVADLAIPLFSIFALFLGVLVFLRKRSSLPKTFSDHIALFNVKIKNKGYDFPLSMALHEIIVDLPDNPEIGLSASDLSKRLALHIYANVHDPKLLPDLSKFIKALPRKMDKTVDNGKV